MLLSTVKAKATVLILSLTFAGGIGIYQGISDETQKLEFQKQVAAIAEQGEARNSSLKEKMDNAFKEIKEKEARDKAAEEARKKAEEEAKIKAEQKAIAERQRQEQAERRVQQRQEKLTQQSICRTEKPNPQHAPRREEPQKNLGMVIRVVGSGGQAEIDRRIGAINESQVSGYLGAPYISQHHSCGGRRFLSLGAGSTVTLTETVGGGTYRVEGTKRVHYGQDAGVVPRGYDAYLQTCESDSSSQGIPMRVVMLKRIS